MTRKEVAKHLGLNIRKLYRKPEIYKEFMEKHQHIPPRTTDEELYKDQMEGFERLVEDIFKVAVFDLKFNAATEKSIRNKSSAQKFIKSQWCKTLCGFIGVGYERFTNAINQKLGGDYA